MFIIKALVCITDNRIGNGHRGSTRRRDLVWITTQAVAILIPIVNAALQALVTGMSTVEAWIFTLQSTASMLNCTVAEANSDFAYVASTCGAVWRSLSKESWPFAMHLCRKRTGRHRTHHRHVLSHATRCSFAKLGEFSVSSQGKKGKKEWGATLKR